MVDENRLFWYNRIKLDIGVMILNILHMRYAVEVAQAGSINKASERLLVAQPNLSRSIKELEADLGITLFDRSSRGMFLTPDGEQFIGYAKKILNQIDEVEQVYKGGKSLKRRFSVSVPRSSYICDAFAHFCNTIEPGSAVISYQETNSGQVIQNVLSSDCKIGVVRYAETYDSYFKTSFAEKGLVSEPIREFRHMLLMRKDSPLAKIQTVNYHDLESCVEIIYADAYVPSLRLPKHEEPTEEHGRHVYVLERASQLELLAQNPEAFAWVSPSPAQLLKRYGLIQRDFPETRQISKDVLIYHKDYRLSNLDKRFIEILKSYSEI